MVDLLKPLPPALLNLLCNPYNGEPLQLEGDALVGASSGQRFPIVEGIPSFVVGGRTPRRNRFWRWFYDSIAFTYDPVLALGDRLKLAAEEEVRREYVAELAVRPGDKVLETAVGTAANLQHLPAQGEYYGLDISFHMLRQARRNLARWGRPARLVQADVQYLPFRDGTFDLVLQMGALQFLADPFLAVREMARVARMGATIHVLDEVPSLRRLFKRLPAHADQVRDRQTALETLPRLVPRAYRANARVEVVAGGQFYAMQYTVNSRQ